MYSVKCNSREIPRELPQKMKMTMNYDFNSFADWKIAFGRR